MAQQQPADEVKSTVFIRNIPYSAAAQELGNLFKEKFGDITDARILTERMYGKEVSRGIGFVEFASPDSLQKALAANDVELNGRKLRILQARPKKVHNTAFVKGVPNGTEEESVVNAFQNVKPVQVKIIKFNNNGFLGFAFAKFNSQEDLRSALDGNKEITLGGEQSRVFFAKTNLDEPRKRSYRRRRYYRRRAPRQQQQQS